MFLVRIKDPRAPTKDRILVIFFLVKEIEEDPSFEEDFFATSDSSSSEEPDIINNEIRDLIADRVRESEVKRI